MFMSGAHELITQGHRTGTAEKEGDPHPVMLAESETTRNFYYIDLIDWSILHAQAVMDSVL